MKHFFAIFLFVLASLSLSASHIHLSLTGVSSGSHFYYCTTVDSVIVHKPNVAPSGAVQWNHSGYPAIVCDSIIVTQSMQGQWTCQYSPVDIIEFYIHFTAISPTEPWVAVDTTKCTETAVLLSAQTVHQPDFVYLWSDGSTGQYLSVGAPSIPTVTITGACATVNDQIEVLNYPVPDPDLGLDVVACDGNTVTLDPGAFTGYAWSTSVSTPTIDVTSDGTYRVTITDVNGCHGSDTIDVTFLIPPIPDIKVVTVETDPISPLYQNNKVIWEVDASNVDSVYIYREFTTADYQKVAAVAYGDGFFTDTVSSKMRAWSYKIAFKDTCGNLSALSLWHTTCKVSVNYTVGGFTANWTDYDVEGGAKSSISRYELYTGDLLNSLTYLTYVPGSQNTYGPFTFSDSLVVVAAVITTTTKTEVTALSFPITEADTMTNVDENEMLKLISLYPNPSTGNFTVSGEGVMSIYNVIGECVSTETIYGITTVHLNSGIYMVKITNKQNATLTQKVIVH